jgi:uncharacterized membrane-anchored protein
VADLSDATTWALACRRDSGPPGRLGQHYRLCDGSGVITHESHPDAMEFVPVGG